MGGFGKFGGIQVDHGDKQPTVFFDRLVDDLRHFLGTGAPDLAQRLFHDVAAAQDFVTVLLGIERGLEGVAGPDCEHLAVALNDFLVHVRRRTTTRVRRATVALLVAAHPDHARAPTAHVMGSQHQVHQGRLDAVIVVTPDDALLVAVHGPGRVAGGLGLVGPFRRLDQLVLADAGNPAGFVQALAIRFQGVLEAGGVRFDERLVVPALIDNVGQQAVEQGGIGARLDVQEQDVVLAHRLFEQGDGECPARIDQDDLRLLDGFPILVDRLLLVGSLALQAREPVVEKVVGLGFIGIGADGENAVGHLGVFVAVVQLPDPHIPGGVAL